MPNPNKLPEINYLLKMMAREELITVNKTAEIQAFRSR